MLLRLEGVARSFGGRDLFRDVALEVRRDDRIGLVGPNGAGKTTLLRIAAGDEAPDAGRLLIPRNVRVGMLKQEIDPNRDISVFDEVASALSHLDALEQELGQLESEMARLGAGGSEIPADVAARYDSVRSAYELGGGFERAARVERILAGLGFDTTASARPLDSFSGGWMMRVELAKLLLRAPDVLLLDEPTNHLDLPSIQWFENALASYPGAAIIISHDRTFLRRHATRIADLEAGRFTVYDGSYDGYLEYRDERRSQLLANRAAQDRRVAETERFIDRFRYKASKARQVQSRVKALEKLERIEVGSEGSASMRLRIPEPARAGNEVLRLANVHKRYGETPVYRGVDLLVRRGDRVALVGPNGAGKSTLLRIAAGVLPIDAGERRLGHNVEVAFFAQHQLEVLDTGRTVLKELESASSVSDFPRLRGHLGAFLFSGDDVEKPVGVLSGGEKARLALAKMLLRPSNFLILDEPTNHLDVDACEVLEAALADYAGTLMLISHDRAFINALATRIVDVRQGVLTDHLGNYDDYLRADEERPVDPATPRDKETAGASVTAKRERISQREQAKTAARRLARARKRAAELEGEIPQLEAELQQLDWRAAAPEVFRDGAAARSVEDQRTALRAVLDERYSEWAQWVTEIESADAPGT